MPIQAINADVLTKMFQDQGGSTSEIKPKYGDEIFAGTDYPREWSGFVGQDQAKEQLIVQAASAKARGARIEHTLLSSGIHGVGKTTLATLVASTAGVGFLQTTGPLTVDDAFDLISSMQDNDILFIDEAHLLVQKSRTGADWLLPFMTEGVLYTKRGPQVMPNIAIVAATTDAGKLPETMLSRFMCTPEIVHYTEVEAGQIADSLAGRMGVDIGDQGQAIAVAADRNPRAMRKILTSVRDLSYAYPTSHPNLDRAFRFAGVSPDGLSTVARDILLVLLQSRDFSASVESIAAHLGEPGPLKHHEKQLLQHGYLDITSRGRSLTDRGQDRALTEARLRIQETK